MKTHTTGVVGRAGSSEENAETLWGSRRAEKRWCEGPVKKRDIGNLECFFVSLREAVVEGWDVSNDDGRRVVECEMDV